MESEKIDTSLSMRDSALDELKKLYGILRADVKTDEFYYFELTGEKIKINARFGARKFNLILTDIDVKYSRNIDYNLLLYSVNIFSVRVKLIKIIEMYEEMLISDCFFLDKTNKKLKYEMKLSGKNVSSLQFLVDD